MRNRRRCEDNRKRRLIDTAALAFTVGNHLTRKILLDKVRASNDWKRCTRVTRALVEEYIEMWTAREV